MDTSIRPLADETAPDGSLALQDALGLLASRWKLLAAAFVVGSVAGLGIAFAIPPVYTARGLVLPPTQNQSTAAAALGSLGSLAGGSLSGLGNLRSPADQFVTLMQSASIGKKLVDRFKLVEFYEVRYRDDAYGELLRDTRMLVGKRDGLISIEVDSTDPKLAAELANAYVDSLRELLGSLAITEAQQRRAFFEARLRETSGRLEQAQRELQASGFNSRAMKSDPKSASEAYARLRAELTAAEVKLQSQRQVLADVSPEIQQQQATISALRQQLAGIEARAPAETNGAGRDYTTLYREFKYQETLFDLFARQYELARADESREGVLLQVVDRATAPERKSKPSRGLVAASVALATLLAAGLWVLVRRPRRADARAA